MKDILLGIQYDPEQNNYIYSSAYLNRKSVIWKSV